MYIAPEEKGCATRFGYGSGAGRIGAHNAVYGFGPINAT